jgi:hypothetical protein
MATIVTRSGKGSALTFAEMDANFTNLNDELANVSLGVLPANSVSATELDNSDDYTVNTLTTTGNVIVGDSLIPSSGNLEINTDYLVVSDASGTEKFKIRTDVAPGPDQVLKYNETSGFVQWSNDLGQTSTQVQSALTSQVLNEHADVTITSPTNGQVLKYNGTLWVNDSDTDTGLLNVVEDTTPQLGGDLDVNGNNIVSVSAGNVVIAPDSANSEGYSTATLDVSSGHFKLKAGLVLDHPGTAGLDAQYSNYITVATTDGDLNMSSNGAGRIRPRSDFQIRGSDGCDLWLRSEFSTDAKISYRGGSTEQGYLVVDRNNSEVKYYTNSWDQKMESDSGEVRLQSNSSNVRAVAQDIILQANDDIDIRAADRFQFRNKDSGTSEYNETMTLFQNFSGITGTAATGAVVESSSGKQSGDYDTSLVIRKFDEGDGGSTAHSGISQRIAQYELTLEAGKSTLALNYRDDDNTGAAQNTATLLKFKNSTSETATAATQNAPDTMELNVDVVEQYSAEGMIIHNFTQGNNPDLGAGPGTVFGQGLDIQSNGSYTGLNLWSHKSNTGYPNIWAHRNRDDGAGNKDFLNNNDRIFNFLGSGWNGDADTPGAYYGAFAPVGELILVANEDHSASARGGKWQFLTTSTGSTSGSVKMEIGDEINAKTAIQLDEVSTPTTTTDKGWIYAKDVSGTAEVFVKDAAGNETQISPHNAQGEWEYFSKNVKTGKTVRINMEEMIRDIEQLTGKTYIKDE